MTAPGPPERPSVDGLDGKWAAQWDESGVYSFDRSHSRDSVYSIDTPPPTVSGSLHIGHVFSYTQTDVLARFHRMRGAEVFYPMGWDDNGLATERRVQNHYGVTCDPSLPYDPDFTPPDPRPVQQVPISRPNFIGLCEQLTAEDEKRFEALWRRLGISVDWSLTYNTIGEHARHISQLSFLHLLERELVYLQEAPTLWDADFGTAVAQAEVEDRERPGAYHGIRFATGDSSLTIETTRPELLAACVALVCHPDDERYSALAATTATVPMFGTSVPVLTHPLAQPDKGTGLAMVCTFGDLTDVTWWRELQLPVRSIMRTDGRLQMPTFGGAGWESSDPARANEAGAQLDGLKVAAARRRIVELLAEAGALVGEARQIMHAVKFYEKGDRPLEIITSRQWFVRTMPFRGETLERGEQLDWHPGYMSSRYDSWINGLNGDWCVSRQRFFGVPLPIWYPIGDDGIALRQSPIVAKPDDLPVDPSSDTPSGYEPHQRDAPGGFTADRDVLDTWATSSLSPLLVSGWQYDDDLFARVFPMDLRPQAHDIIRTWLFYTVLRSHIELNELPWKSVAISGWVVDPTKKKMAKSKGNTVSPDGIITEFGADAVRYWAASARLGVDTAFDTAQMRVGRRLVTKLLNASRFVLERAAGGQLDAPITAPLDRALLARLAEVTQRATEAFESYEYSRALEAVERFFWPFCDNYLELAKNRSYGDPNDPATASALATLQLALSVQLRLLAPFTPFVCEEVWSWWQLGSIHRSAWPQAAEFAAAAEGTGPLDVGEEVLSAVRRAKSTAKRSQRTPVDLLSVHASAQQIDDLRAALDDVVAAGTVARVELSEANELSVQVELAKPEPAAAG